MNTSCKQDETPERMLNDDLAFNALKKYQEQIQQYFPEPAAMAEIARKMNEFVPTEKHQHHGQYDIFLSYRSVDHPRCKHLKALFEGLGYTVYWDRDDPDLENKPVTGKTAEILRGRMRRCRALVFAVSSYSGESHWMPWELGFFDGRTGRVFVYPLDDGIVEQQTGQQYLDFYPLIDVKNAKAWLEIHLPHKEPAIPWGEPAGPEMTEDYGNWFGRNWERIVTDPSFATELWGNLLQAWFRLSPRTTDRSE